MRSGLRAPSCKTKGNGPREAARGSPTTKQQKMGPGRWSRRPLANRLARAQLLGASVWCVVWCVLCGVEVWCGLCSMVVWCGVWCGVGWCGVVCGVVCGCVAWCESVKFVSCSLRYPVAPTTVFCCWRLRPCLLSPPTAWLRALTTTSD